MTASFADLIRNGRKAKGWTQEDLVRASGVSRSTVMRWELGQAKHPEAKHLRSACHALDVSPVRAVIALGYLTREEVDGALDEELEAVVAALLNPKINTAVRTAWVDYLMYLASKEGV